MFYFELTDLFGGEANYNWVKHYGISAKTQLGALRKISKELGCSFKYDIRNYSWKSGQVILFLLDDPVEKCIEL